LRIINVEIIRADQIVTSGIYLVICLTSDYIIYTALAIQ